MFKKISSTSNFGVIETENSKELISVTSNNKVVSFKYDPENFVYFRCRAITADVPNANADYFPEEEVKKAYKTFIGVGLYKDHNADSVSKAIGKILWAEYIPEGKYVELIGCIDKKLDPDTARRVTSGIIDSCSMGCSVTQSVCSVCGNVAYSPKEYCEHINPINGMKGRILSNGKMVYEINKGIQFTELSLVTSPADKTARLFEVVASKKKASELNYSIVDDFFEKSKNLETFNEAIEIYNKMGADNYYKINPLVSPGFKLTDDKKNAISKLLQFFFALNHPIYKLAFTYRNITELEDLKKFGYAVDDAFKKIIMKNISADVDGKSEEEIVRTFRDEFSVATSILNANGIFSPFPVSSNKRELFLNFANSSSPNKHFYFYKNYIRNGLFVALPGLLPYIELLYYKTNAKTYSSKEVFGKIKFINKMYYSIKSIGNKGWVNDPKIIKNMKDIYSKLDDYFNNIGVEMDTPFEDKYLNELILDKVKGYPGLCASTNMLMYGNQFAFKKILDFISKVKVLLASDEFSGIWDEKNFDLISNTFENEEKQYIHNFGIKYIKNPKIKEFYNEIKDLMFEGSKKISIEKIKEFIPKNFELTLSSEDINYGLLKDSIINVDFLGLLNYSRYYNRIDKILLPNDAKEITGMKKEKSLLPKLNTIDKFLKNVGGVDVSNSVSNAIKAFQSNVKDYYIDIGQKPQWLEPIENKKIDIKVEKKEDVIRNLLTEEFQKISEKKSLSENISILKNIYDIINNSTLDKDIVNRLIEESIAKTQGFRRYFAKNFEILNSLDRQIDTLFLSVNSLIANYNKNKNSNFVKEITHVLKEIRDTINFIKTIIPDADIRENYLGYTKDFLDWIERFNLGFGSVSKSYNELIKKTSDLLLKYNNQIIKLIELLEKISKKESGLIKQSRVDGETLLGKIDYVVGNFDKVIYWINEIKQVFKQYSEEMVKEEKFKDMTSDSVKLFEAFKKSIPKNISELSGDKLKVFEDVLGDLYINIKISKQKILENKPEDIKYYADFYNNLVKDIILNISNISKYNQNIKNKLTDFKNLLFDLSNWDKKSSLYLKKDRYIEGSLKFFYVKGEGFRSSKIICKQGNKAVRTSLFNVLPADVMLDIVDNEDTRFSPEDLVENLKNKFSSIEEFAQWVKRSFKNRRK